MNKECRNTSMMKSYTFAKFIISFLCLVQLQAQPLPTPIPTPVEPRPFPTDIFLRLGDSIGNSWDDAATRFSASIFESLTNRELFNTYLLGDLQTGLRVQRRVFDNQDIIDSWTVIDIMKVPFYFPIPILSGETGLGTGNFGINMGLSFGGEAYHIRQVSPKDWKNIESVKSIEENLDQIEDQSGELSEQISSNQGLSEFDIIHEEDSQAGPLDGLSRFIFWRSQNPRIRARYNKLWNLLTHPLKLPLSAKRMDKYRIGDVASYGLEGAVQLGISAGWTDFSIAGTNFTSTRAGLGITTYLKGDFRISLWKENESFAHVKLTKALNRGTSVNLGELSIDQNLFSGFLLFDKKVFTIKDQFIPFSFSLNRNKARQFDIGYRYDMRLPNARLAYEEAVLGRFKKSHDMALKVGSGVSESFTRDSTTTANSKSYKMKLSLFLEKANSNSQAKTWATITMDDVEHTLYSSQSLTLKAYDSLWGRSEIKRHQFLTTYNERIYQRNPKEGLGMRIEGRLEDSHTSSKELFKYISEVETAIGKPGLFPRPPKYFPTLSCDEVEDHIPGADEDDCQREGDGKEKLARYGTTSFFYQVDLNLDHLFNIRNATKSEFWRAFEEAFVIEEGRWSKPWRRGLSFAVNSYASLLNIPLSLLNINLNNGGRLIVAQRFYRSWKKLKKIKDPIKLVNAFGNLYKTLHYSPEFVKATRILAGSAPAKFYLTAKADQVFGQISEGGTTLGDIFPIGDEARRRIDFDRFGPRINADKNALVTNLKFKKLDEDTAKLTFNLLRKPEYLYLRVDQAPSWGRYQNLVRLIVKNNGEFKKGINTLTIKRDNRNGYLGRLRKAFFNGKYSTFMMAYSIEEQNFGSVSSVRFRLKESVRTSDNL